MSPDGGLHLSLQVVGDFQRFFRSGRRVIWRDIFHNFNNSVKLGNSPNNGGIACVTVFLYGKNLFISHILDTWLTIKWAVSLGHGTPADLWFVSFCFSYSCKCIKPFSFHDPSTEGRLKLVRPIYSLLQAVVKKNDKGLIQGHKGGRVDPTHL